MSTIDKCCEITKELEDVFQEIRKVNGKSFEKKKEPSTISEQDKKKILKLFNYDKWEGYVKWIDEKLEESG